MIRLNTVTNLDRTEFNTLFADSVEQDDITGAFPWESYKLSNATFSEKRKFMHVLFTLSNRQIIEIREDNLLIGLLLANWEDARGDESLELSVSVNLIGPDSNDSKEWIFSEEFADARNDYWDRIGVNGWTQRTQGEGSAGYNYILRAEELNTLKATYEFITQELPSAEEAAKLGITLPEYPLVDAKLTKV